MKNIIVWRFVLTLSTLISVLILCVITAWLVHNVSVNGLLGIIWGSLGINGWFYFDMKWDDKWGLEKCEKCSERIPRYDINKNKNMCSRCERRIEWDKYRKG